MSFVLRVRVPTWVRVSFWAEMSLAAVAFVNLVRSIVSEQATTGTIVLALFTALALNLGLPLAFARGFNWARVTLTVLEALGLVEILIQAARGKFVSDPLGYAVIAIGILAVVLLYVPSSRAFFRDAKAERAKFNSQRAALAPTLRLSDPPDDTH